MKTGTDTALLKAFEKLVARVGAQKAMALLIEEGVGPTTAQRLASGRYDNRPGGMLRTTLTKLVSEHVEAS